MATYLDVLTEAISDVGYWRWWVASYPEWFQVEFGGTQLWNPPLEEGKPPSGVVALRFDDPVSVSFLTHQDAPGDFPEDWPQRLHNDSIESLAVTHERFGFNDPKLIEELLSESRHVDKNVGSGVGSDEFVAAKITLAFRAGPAGLIVAAQHLTVLNFQGPITPDEVENKHVQWWDYWEEYWRRIDTDDPMPEDYACEVTIPAGE